MVHVNRFLELAELLCLPDFTIFPGVYSYNVRLLDYSTNIRSLLEPTKGLRLVRHPRLPVPRRRLRQAGGGLSRSAGPAVNVRPLVLQEGPQVNILIMREMAW